MTLIGYSLGGNVALKLVGELGNAAEKLIQHVIAVGPPVNLKTSVDLLGLKKNAFYQRYFVHLLRSDVHERQRLFADLPKIHLPFSITIYQFDEMFLAPHIGYKNALEYYEKCSSLPLIQNITVPCHILFAKDDPIIHAHAFDGITIPSHIQVCKTNNGGHLGFLGNPWKKKGVRWMDTAVLSWVLEKIQAA